MCYQTERQKSFYQSSFCVALGNAVSRGVACRGVESEDIESCRVVWHRGSTRFYVKRYMARLLSLSA